MEPVSKLTLLTEKESFSTLADEAHIYLHKPLTCGRDPYRNDLVVPSPHASRHHFEIYCVALEDGPDDENQQTPLVFLHCLNSSNGVLVNGKRLRKARGIQAACLLCHRDIIEVVPGLTFRYEEVFRSATTSADCRMHSQQRRELQFLKEEYTVSDRCIGNGANAQVFLGENCQTFDQVAVKINKLGCDGIPTLEMKRALQEAEMLGRLDHPNIVSCQRAFKTHIGVYIFLELASGGDLFSLILRRKWFTESEICVIIHQVMIAVQYIHSQGIVHRDIKPENILFAVTPRIGHRIVLTDFGSAGMVALGRLTSRVGTEYYRPPECRKCAGLHDRAADLWAVGLVTLQLFAVQEVMPYMDEVRPSSQEWIDRYLQSKLAKRVESGEISDSALAFIRGCLTFDGEKRFTAGAALEHEWFSKSADTLREVHEDINRNWKARGRAVEHVSDMTAFTRPQTTQATRSQHFGKRCLGPSIRRQGGKSVLRHAENAKTRRRRRRDLSGPDASSVQAKSPADASANMDLECI